METILACVWYFRGISEVVKPAWFEEKDYILFERELSARRRAIRALSVPFTYIR